MNVFSAIDIGNNKDCICIVGAGGKTSTMFALAKELRSLNKKVVVTTTTKIYYPDKELYDNILVSCHESRILSFIDNIEHAGINIIGSSVIEENKLKGVQPQLICKLFEKNNIDYVLVECDGSRGKPIKAPAEFEPVVPACAAKVLGIIGLDAVGKKADEMTVHRLHEFCKAAECKIGEVITIHHIEKLICHSDGLFKNTPKHIQRYVVLNKADTKERLQYAVDIKKLLADRVDLKVLIAQMQHYDPILDTGE